MCSMNSAQINNVSQCKHYICDYNVNMLTVGVGIFDWHVLAAIHTTDPTLTVTQIRNIFERSFNIYSRNWQTNK